MFFSPNHLPKKIAYLLSFLGVFCLCNQVVANNNPIVYLTHLTQKNGLPSNYINQIIKDNQGLLWIATNNGLCRYETQDRIKVYQVRADSSTIHSSNIWTIYADSKDNLWIGTRHGGLTRYHQPTDSWTTFKHNPTDSTSISNNEILSILEDHKGRIWIGTENGLNLFQSKTASFISFQVQKGNPSALRAKAVLSLLEDSLHRLWIGTWGGGLHLMLVDPQKDISQSSFRNFIPFMDEGSHNIWDLTEYKSNQFFLGSHGGGLLTMQLPEKATASEDLQNWEPSFRRYQHQPNDPHSLAHDDIKDLLLDRSGQLWIATGRGINFIPAAHFFNNTKMDTPPIEFSLINKQNQNQNALVNNAVIDIFQDDQNLFWFGTIGGISILNPFINQFKQYKLPDFAKNDSHRNMVSIDEDGTISLLSSKYGLVNYDFEKNIKTVLPQKNAVINKHTNTVFAASNNRLFLGSEKGIAIFDKKEQSTQFYPFPASLPNLNNVFFRHIYQDNVIYKIWAATDKGLLVLDEQSGNYQLFTNNPNNGQSLSENSLNQIYEDNLGYLWITTYAGLNRIALVSFEANPVFELFHSEASHPNHKIPINKILSLESIDSMLYIGTNNGLLAYNNHQKKFLNFSPSKNKYWIRSLAATKEGHLWGATTEGLFFFDTKKQTFNEFGKEDGLVETTFKVNGGFKDQKGNIYFAHHKGIILIPCGNILTNEVPPRLEITDIRILNSRGEQWYDGIFLEELALDDDTYYISLKFAALNYNRPEKNQYAYRLKGFEERWNYTPKTEAIYTNLDPGNYIFQLKAANNDGVWNEEGTSIKIIKHPAFWETGWFLSICLLGLDLIVGGGVRLYTQNIRHRNLTLQTYNRTIDEQNKKLTSTITQLKRANDELTQFAYVTSHDLKAPLRGIAALANFIREDLNEDITPEIKQAVFENLDLLEGRISRMGGLIKGILAYSRIGRTTNEAETIDLKEWLRELLDSFALDENTVVYISPELPVIYTQKIAIHQIFQNLIANAIKYNDKDKCIINIDFTDMESHYQFAVSDNGPGIPAKYHLKVFTIFQTLQARDRVESTGIGLSIVKKQVEQLDGQIWIESELNNGTTFFFTIKK